MGSSTALRAQHGLVGYGIPAFQPLCAYGCRDAISGATLNCSMVESNDMGGMSDMAGMAMTDPSCYATDDAFLQTLAWCISSKCKDVQASTLEQYWQDNVPGSYAVQPSPKETYQQTLARINGTPSVVYSGSGSLNQTSVLAEDAWFGAYNTDKVFLQQEKQQEGFGLVILLSGVLIPIAFSLLRFVPFPNIWRTQFNAWIIDPPLFGTKADTPVLFGLFQMPKRGQALFIFYFILINVVLSAVNYEYADPNVWYPNNRWRWMVMLVSNRFGILSFANMPLIFLYAGRNNFLLWVTNWSHYTFLLVHRWIAIIATFQAIFHSLLYLYAYVKAGTHSAESKLPYWIWGIVGTISMSILLPTSVMPIRRKAYELFLTWHVAISILVVVGCYYHILKEFQHQWGYELWIVLCMAVWGFDRLFRMLRLARYGIKQATITAVDDQYLRITVPGVVASGHAYLYFPTLTWRVWENHPFSVASTILPLPPSSTPSPNHSVSDIEKLPHVTANPTHSPSGSTSGASTTTSAPQVGITFYVRTHAGLTALLRARSAIPILIEAGYTSDSHSLASAHTASTLIALAGGVGITATLPHLHTHAGRAKLYWGCRTQALVDDVKRSGALTDVEQEVVIGRRMDVREILEAELGNCSGKNEVCVLVSGPEGMIDEVRCAYTEIVRKRTVTARLVVESFSW
ncbi:ferric reductase-like protein transmembrane component 4 [Myriangium duriaei CBS 260.36]|uniref:Ferric reductase-like protein transmembrane component 4 n=1 Tax=Myriangium duriaei CBS 260.36 TaxID=1168546 RepID=A0A9P4MJL9_9PEZI|nr:ferric reductase-like protein transmembrane component 4 [Myriangium duriaei CBS 260.36]